MMKWTILAILPVLLALAPPASAAPGEPAHVAQASQKDFDPAPWLADLAQMRAAMNEKYANLEWLLTERELDLDGLFARAEKAFEDANSEADAVRLFDQVIRRIDDGHFRIDWPHAPRASRAPTAQGTVPTPTIAGFCAARGYRSGGSSKGAAPLLAGYSPVAQGELLEAGTIQRNGTRIGIIRIDYFDPHVSASLCEDAVKKLSIALDQPCDAACNNAILTHAYRSLTATLKHRLEALKASGAKLILVDVTGNGGGSEWAEVAARMITPKPLSSAKLEVVRGPHWTRLWTEQAERLQGYAAGSPGADRTKLLAWAAEARTIAAETARRCPPGGTPTCPWLVPAGFSTGLVGKVTAGEYAHHEWGVHLFNPGQHPYSDGIWDGPVAVLIDDATFSAAEQFAALLQDNNAALIVGTRSGGAGCGYSWGGTPTRLTNSGATLHLPDCARMRRDGSNEVRGVIPHVHVPWRANDGRALKASLLETVLPDLLVRSQGG